MRINDLDNINWEAVTIEELVKAHEFRGIDFEVNNGKITRVYIPREELD